MFNYTQDTEQIKLYYQRKAAGYIWPELPSDIVLPVVGREGSQRGGFPLGGNPEGGRQAMGLSIGSYRDAAIKVPAFAVHAKREIGIYQGTHRVSLWDGGNLVEVMRYKEPYQDERNKGARQEIKDFTAASRARMYKRLSKFKRDVLIRGLFVTLTYHRNVVSGKETKGNLRALIRRIQRKYPKACIVWKLEFQKRGAVHYHLLVLGVKRIGKEWLSKAWNEIAEFGDGDHLKAGTKVEAVKDYRGVMIYAGKYIAKRVDGDKPADLEPGRFWGVVGPYWLYQATPVRVELNYSQAVNLYRFMDNLKKSKSRQLASELKKKGINYRPNKKRFKAGVCHFWYALPEGIISKLSEICKV